MQAAGPEIKTIEVGEFDRVSLRSQHSNELFITQGELQTLSIESTPQILDRIETTVSQGKLKVTLGGNLGDRIKDALTTSLTRPHITTNITVKQLRGLEVAAVAFALVKKMETDELTISYNGPGEIRFERLLAEKLTVRNAGTGMISLAGRVNEQDVMLNGPGEYSAKGLSSKRTKISVKGIGNATICVEEKLDVQISGMGGVLYFGEPEIRSKISPMGSLKALGRP